MMDDATLLRRYTHDRSEDDFAELVRRHLNLVYSAALRQVNGDTHHAQDVAQLVFTDLARKAAKLADHRVLAGWLFTSTRFAAAKLVRGERRRQIREQEALRMQETSPSDPASEVDWEHIRPVLDEALAELDERDREAILLRYMGGCDYAQIGVKLALSDNAARMRVDRAVDKLRSLLARRGATSTAAALSLALANQAIVAAPAGLAATVTSAALAGTGTVAAATFMSLTKLQIGLAGAVLVTSAGFYAVQAHANAALRDQLARLPDQSSEIARLREENAQLEHAASQVADLNVSDAELARLRDEAVALERRLQPAAQPEPPSSPAHQSSGTTGKTFQEADLDEKPKPVAREPPVYPPELRKAGIEGEATVSFIVDSSGKVLEARAVKSSRPEFEAPCVAAVSNWQFEPGRIKGQPVNTQVVLPITFKMDNSNAAAALGDWF
jgi:RNA polymerase sigma factor (sigma-70 family)